MVSTLCQSFERDPRTLYHLSTLQAQCGLRYCFTGPGKTADKLIDGWPDMPTNKWEWWPAYIWGASSKGKTHHAPSQGDTLRCSRHSSAAGRDTCLACSFSASFCGSTMPSRSRHTVVTSSSTNTPHPLGASSPSPNTCTCRTHVHRKLSQRVQTTGLLVQLAPACSDSAFIIREEKVSAGCSTGSVCYAGTCHAD